jgi:hypothetical protein
MFLWTLKGRDQNGDVAVPLLNWNVLLQIMGRHKLEGRDLLLCNYLSLTRNNAQETA